jgi:hypothetical protein
MELPLELPWLDGEIPPEQIRREIEKHMSTFDGIGHDNEGFIVCAFHRERRYGWRSVPYQATKMPVPMAHWTPLEYERWLLFGDTPRIQPDFHAVPAKDQRDNRDPEEVGMKIMHKKNGKSSKRRVGS